MRPMAPIHHPRNCAHVYRRCQSVHNGDGDGEERRKSGSELEPAPVPRAAGAVRYTSCSKSRMLAGVVDGSSLHWELHVRETGKNTAPRPRQTTPVESHRGLGSATATATRQGLWWPWSWPTHAPAPARKPAASAAGADTLDGAAPADSCAFFFPPQSRHIFPLAFALFAVACGYGGRLGRHEQLAHQLAVSAAWERCSAGRGRAVPGRSAVEIPCTLSRVLTRASVRPWEQSRAGTAHARQRRRRSGWDGSQGRARRAQPGWGSSVDWLVWLACWGRGSDGAGEVEPGRDRVGSWLRPPAGERHPAGSFSCGAYGARDRSQLPIIIRQKWRRHQRPGLHHKLCVSTSRFQHFCSKYWALVGIWD